MANNKPKNEDEVKTEDVKTEEIKTEEIFVPKGYVNEEPNLLISINGKNWVLPRGKTSTVPYYVAEEFRRSQRAQAIMDEHIDSMLGASN